MQLMLFRRCGKSLSSDIMTRLTDSHRLFIAKAGKSTSVMRAVGQEHIVRDISLHLLDILTNSVSAGASHMMIRIRTDQHKDLLTIRIEDDGKCMHPDFLKRVTDPFSTTRTTRKVGLGLSLFKEACEITGGNLAIESILGIGTTVTATMGISSIDRIPLGNTGETLSGLISSFPDRDFAIVFLNDQGEEEVLDTMDLRERLGDVPLSQPDVYVFVRDFIQEQQQNILGGI